MHQSFLSHQSKFLYMQGECRKVRCDCGVIHCRQECYHRSNWRRGILHVNLFGTLLSHASDLIDSVLYMNHVTEQTTVDG